MKKQNIYSLKKLKDEINYLLSFLSLHLKIFFNVSFSIPIIKSNIINKFNRFLISCRFSLTVTTLSNIVMLTRILHKISESLILELFEVSRNFGGAILKRSDSLIPYYITLRQSHGFSQENFPRKLSEKISRENFLMLYCCKDYKNVTRDKKFLQRRFFVCFWGFGNSLLKYKKFFKIGARNLCFPKYEKTFNIVVFLTFQAILLLVFKIYLYKSRSYGFVCLKSLLLEIKKINHLEKTIAEATANNHTYLHGIKLVTS